MSYSLDTKIDQWVSLVADDRISLIEKCLLLSRLIEYSDLNITKYVAKIVELGTTLREATNQVKNPTYLISMLNEHLFDNYGLHGEQDDYYNPKNNFLNEVIDKKSGLPITISILYVEIAKYLGLDIQIVGFPSHVIVKYKDFIIDPFHGGRILQIEDLQQILDVNFGGELDFSPDFLNAISQQKILIRIVRNLKNSYMQSYAFEKALLCVEMVMVFEKNAAQDIRDKGIIEEKLEHFQSALKHLNHYLEIHPNAEDVDFILDLIRNIRIKISQ